MNITKEEVQQVLDALTCCEDHPHWCTHCDDYVDRSGEVVTLLQSKLAEPDAEPVTWGVDWGTNGDRSCVSIIKKCPDGILEVVATEYAPAHTDHPMRHYDRTCPACQDAMPEKQGK